MIRFLKSLRQDCAGSTIVEFALLAPVTVVLTLGSLQIGMWMHGYNALRSLASETARHTTVQYQKGVRIDYIAMANWARSRAASSAYGFPIANVSTAVVDDASQTITGVTRKNLTVNYRMPSIMRMAGVGNIELTFSRPIFVKST